MTNPGARILALGAIALVGLVVIFIRVVYLASAGGSLSSRDDAPVRGTIQDRRGLVLASTEEASTIAVAPREVIDSEFTAASLSRWIHLPKRELLEKIEAGETRLHVPLARQVDNYLADRVMELRLPGVHRTREFRRVYPYGELAANLLGFTGRDATNALAGVELAYNRVLVSTPTRGSTIVHLSLDALIQHSLETELDRGLRESRSKRAVGIVMKVKSGEIAAMAVRPTFDPNRYWDSQPFARNNWAIRFNYEPGSTVKVFMAAMLLNERRIDPTEHFLCRGSIAFGDTVVHCKTRNQIHAHGSLTLRDILRRSCNVGIIAAMQRLPPAKVHEYMEGLGFGRRTELFPEAGLETTGYLPQLSAWVPSSKFYVPIGQSFSVTPLQLLRAGASLANGGRLMRPFVVQRVTDESGHPMQEAESQSLPNPFRPEVNQAIVEMMRAVVESGTGAGAAVRGIRVAGKTGTGQKATAAGYVDRYVASFLGFFPAEQPEYAMLILFDEPAGHAGGGSLAAPVFGRVLESIRPVIDRGVRTVHVDELRLTPQKQAAAGERDTMPELRGLTARESLELLPAGIDVRLFGSGTVFRQSPPAGTPLGSVAAVQLYLDTH